jgi:hypothetical protein
MSGWPAALRLQTRKILDGIDPFPIGGILTMKNIGTFSAYLKQADLSNGQIIIYDTETQLTTCFESAGELFDAGWIADLQPASQFPLLSNTEATAAQHDLPAAVKDLPTHAMNPEANKVRDSA